VTLLAISFPQCYVTFIFQFFKLCLSALPSLPPSHLFLFWPSFLLQQHLPGKLKALSSNPRTTTKTKKEKNIQNVYCPEN
jgi:hypothetical protein